MNGPQRLSLEDLRDLAVGATIFGSAGGGSPELGNFVVDGIGKFTDGVSLLPLGDVPDESLVVAVAGFGSPEVILSKPSVIENFHAVELIERVISRKVDFVVPYESGGLNSLTPFFVAAMKGIPVLDCDGTGRAVCEWYISMFEVHGIPMAPLAVTNEIGHGAVIYADNMIDVDRYGRAILQEFGLSGGSAGYVMSGAKAKSSLVPDMLSMELGLGREIVASLAAGEDTLDVILKQTGGYLLATGEIVRKDLKTSPIGSDHGVIEVQGDDGQGNLNVHYKNESILARWADGTVAAMLPDIITYLDEKGSPLTNADTREGQRIRVVGVPINEKCRDRRAIPLYQKVLADVLEFKQPYLPIEELQH